ncbi:MAG: hypothetical protein NTV28_03885 [Propionibacteriales bacterium]|nr:hypothetical protein [Propionibacteriales bacterium]
MGDTFTAPTGRRTRRRLTLGVVVTASAGLVTFGLMPAQAAPQKVLQSVAVSVDDSGAITRITSDTVSQEGDADPEKTEREHDPAKTGSELPLRVLTSYRLGKTVGTDLQDLDGKTGRAEILVTVQNTTVRPKVLSYDANGVGKEAPALVGTPLTVMAAARLDDVDTASVVSASEDGGAGTNGVVSRDADGATQVQWATMLAPPRLATSATFRLVIDSADITPPSFDISAQPGLVTDTSVARLVDSAFSESAGSQRDLETRTISVLTGVGQSLAQAGDVLVKVEQLLSGSARQLGSKTLSDLDRSAGDVDSALSGLASDIDGLESQMSAALDSSSDKAVQQMSDSLGQVKTRVLGDPEKLEEPVTVRPGTGQGATCTLDAAQVRPSATVVGQLRAVRAQLGQLKAESGACRDAVVASLKATLGSTTDVCPATPNAPTTALGALNCASGRLGQSVTAVASAKASVTGSIDALAVGTLSDQLGTVLTDLQGVRGLVSDIRSGAQGSSIGDLVTRLRGILTSISTSSQLSQSLATIHSTAAAQVAALSDGDESVQEQVEALQTTLCTLPDSPERTQAAGLLSGKDCAGLPAPTGDFPEPLAERVDDQLAAWQQIADLSSSTGVPSIVESLRDSIGQVLDATQGGTGSVDEKVDGTLASLDDLFASAPVTCDDDDLPPANALRCTVETLTTSQGQISQDVATAFDGVDDALADANRQVADGSTKVQAGGDAAANGTSSLFGGFGSSLDGIGRALADQGRKQIERQRQRLDAQAAGFETALDSTIAKSTQAIEDRVSASNRDLAASEKELAADFAAIIASIGSPDRAGSGLLVSINIGARNTGASNQKVASAGGAVDAFSGVRATSLDALLLQQEQVAASLQAESAFPAFDLKLPSGSSHTTVFSFHVGKD